MSLAKSHRRKLTASDALELARLADCVSGVLQDQSARRLSLLEWHTAEAAIVIRLLETGAPKPRGTAVLSLGSFQARATTIRLACSRAVRRSR